MNDQNIMDKSLRSVFVGNIPYEATEEKLKDIFSEVGPVISFKLVYDRETGKPKGYGFCEYKDQETALSAMRNLNGYEIGGRTLRVDNACTEKSRMEMQSLLQGPVIENPYGEAVQADKAPEVISKAVASLPPEQMFELMRQMKLCVQNNPAEARNMLLQNPQLAYALLQALVVMRIVDPQTATMMLYKANPNPSPLSPSEKTTPASIVPTAITTSVAPSMVPPPSLAPAGTLPMEGPWPAPRPSIPVFPILPGAGDIDHRSLDPRLSRVADQDLRITPGSMPQTDHFPRDPRMVSMDPRIRSGIQVCPPRQVAPPPSMMVPPMGPRLVPGPPMVNMSAGATDQEKAALIMQVLQLTDEQIAALPPEQRQSILVLKEQIAKSTQ